MKLLTIDVGGTEIKYACLDENLNFSYKNYVPTPYKSLDVFLDTIYKIYEPVKDEVEGIALSLPGFVDSKTGMQRGGGALTYNIGQNIGELLKNKCQCNVHVENDGKAAAMAELWKGNLSDTNNSAVFIIGTGIGGGIIVDHKVIKGYKFTAGEFSFINVNSDRYNDIQSSMMATNCSTPNLLGMYKELTNDDVDGREFFSRYHNGDQNAKEVLEKYCIRVAVQVMNLGILLNCEKVAIGGGISSQECLITEINNAIDKLAVTTLLNSFGENPMRPQVVACKFSNDANLIGAYYSYVNNL